MGTYEHIEKQIEWLATEPDDRCVDCADTMRQMLDEMKRLRRNLNSSSEYSCDLQRIIETICRGDPISDELAAKSPHLASKVRDAFAKLEASDD